MKSEHEIDFYEGELELLETPEALQVFLHSMNSVYQLTDVTDLEAFYVDKEAYEFAQIVAEFQKFLDE